MNQLSWFIGFLTNHNHLHFHNYYTTVWLDLTLTARFGSHPLHINHSPLKHLTIFYTGQFTYTTHYLTIFDFCLKNCFLNNLKHTLKWILPLKISQELMTNIARCKPISICTGITTLQLQTPTLSWTFIVLNQSGLYYSEDATPLRSSYYYVCLTLCNRM